MWLTSLLGNGHGPHSSLCNSILIIESLVFLLV